MSRLPDNLFNEIVDGLQLMLALRLSGAPAADTAGATVRAWETALTAQHQWDGRLDAGRFQTAFALLAGEIRHWPTPADLLDRLPERPLPPLPAPVYRPTAGERKNAAEILKQCRRLLAEKQMNP
ncbi:hypothetical protein [Neisseria leonii]|uniref:hypothetical protein n=1 Tax=Neisseria leonii TaxID=2995413 RepID=UPI00237A9DE7|nr:hypothetical protein [Neisseria sp. 3986]MDD9325637.1 hypothetical protein [Neisseria sp. 3986]